MEKQQKIVSTQKYLWDKKWVRPYESMWSIIRNFRIVNHCFKYKEAMALLDLEIPCFQHGTYANYGILDEKLCIFSKLTTSSYDIKALEDKLLPNNYIYRLKPISKLLKDFPEALTPRLKYCPKCIESGYHSVLHQVSGLCHCFIHNDTKLIYDFQSSYLLGMDRRFDLDVSDASDKRWGLDMFAGGNLCDFQDEKNLLLPIQWKNIKVSVSAFNDSLYQNYKHIYAVTPSLVSRNRESPAGVFLFNRRKEHLPMVTIYNLEESEASFIKSFEGFSKRQFIHDGSGYYISNFSEIVISLQIKSLIKDYSWDNVRYSAFKMYSGDYFYTNDILAINLAFIWEYIGCKDIISCLMLEDATVDTSIYGHKSPINIRHCMNVIESLFGYFVSYIILETHFKLSYKRFLDYHKFQLHDRDRFSFNDLENIPNSEDYIVEKNIDNVTNIYTYR